MTNIKLQLPKTLRNIKLRDFQKYSNIIESNPDADRDFLEIKIMEIFCGLKYKDISSLPVGIFDDATSWMMSMFENKTPLVKRFNMIGSDGVEVEFGFIPNLDKITMGEYIDLNNYFGSDTDLHKAMAVLYRPIHPSYKDKDSYRIGSYEGTSTHSDIMKDMPLDIALGARVFFFAFRDEIINSYDELFAVSNTGGNNSIGGREEGFNSKYEWYKELHALAGGEALRINEATLIPIHEAMIWLQYTKEKIILDNEAIKKNFK